jgi:hypothetical protein
MQLDEMNEDLFMSLDVTPILCEIPNSTSNLFSAMIPRIHQHQLRGAATPRRYNLRRNSDFPCSSTHASRSSEFLQVPMSSSQQRLTNHSQQSIAKLPHARDIREARIDQIIFRVIDPLSSPERPTEPIINISSFEDGTNSSVNRPNSLEIKEPPPPPSSTSDTPLLREIKPYSRSKTAPLSSSASGAQQFLTPKRFEARDLCGSSSNDDSSTGHNSARV